MIIMANLRNKFGYQKIGRFFEINRIALLEKFNFRCGMVPSHVTFHAFIREMDFESVLQAFYKRAKEYVQIEAGEWVNIDGENTKQKAFIFPI